MGVLLEAAARILEELGFSGYTTNAVAERAGVSVGSLYQYFPGKDALTVALIARETAVLLAEARAAAEEADGCAGLAGFVAAAVAHQMRRPVLARLLDFEERRLPLTAEIASVSDTIISCLASVLVRLRVPDREEAAADILAIVKGMVDAAGERGEMVSARLEARVTRAVSGYLGLSWPFAEPGSSYPGTA